MHDELLALLARHLESENAHDMAGTLATLTDDCVFVDTALGTFHGHDGAAEYYRLWWDAFDNEVTPEQLYVVDDHTAVAETRWRGTHVGAFLDIEPTRRAVDVPVAIVVDVRDGLMATERLYWDARSVVDTLTG